ncbi:MAG: hypothetical protein NTW60_02410 [Candidatus Wolfebacteria bacterium]|nr:hypothetical protein [Candidatus Wolfebacteria bacterium]
MNELIQKGLDFMNYASSWFSQNVSGSAATGFFKAILNMVVAVLLFFVDILKWVISKV